MRALPLIVLALAALTPPAGAQATVNDTDFDFTMNLPPGLRELTPSERATGFGGLTPDRAANMPRASSPDGSVWHYYMWLDASTPYNRQISIILRDEDPPFTRPDDMFDSIARTGLLIDKSASGQMGSPVDGFRVVGTFERQNDQVLIRKMQLYLPDPAGKRYATVSMQAFDSDWLIVAPEFEAAMQSVRFRRTPVFPGGGRGPSSGTTRARRPVSADPGSWASLPVAGSMALAFAMLASLFVGGRATR